MEEFLASPQFVSSLGLLLDIIGVVILFNSHGIIKASGAVINTKTQKKGLTFLIVGFTLQFAGTIISY